MKLWVRVVSNFMDNLTGRKQFGERDQSSQASPGPKMQPLLPQPPESTPDLLHSRPAPPDLVFYPIHEEPSLCTDSDDHQ